MKSTNNLKKDPIKEAPLRDPGQSLREELADFRHDNIMLWLVLGLFAVVTAGLEWYDWALDLKPSPVLWSLIAVFMLGLARWKVQRARKIAENLKLGIKGERAIGQFLQHELLPRGYIVFHDIIIDDFNIDHAIIGPRGVFAIETKTRSKARRGDTRVTYDGEKVLVDGLPPDRDPIIQAKAGANRLREILASYSGIQATVKPVVLFPGWFVDKQPKRVETWVLNHKALPSFIDNEPEKIDKGQQDALAAALARYIREHDTE